MGSRALLPATVGADVFLVGSPAFSGQERVRVVLTQDERYLDQLETSLSQVRRKLISIWHDRKILPGQEWGPEIDKNLEEADIVLLLVSPDLLNSEYTYSREMTRALERHKFGQAAVVPIILRPSDWQNSPLEGLQVLPSKGRAVTSWSNRDEAWLDVAQGLRRLISNQR